jgi:aspartate-semialdehyde dehydrogenase
MNFIQSVRSEQFEHVDFVFFASDAECTRKTWKTARNAGSAIIDLSGALDNDPDATVRSLWLERERGRVITPDLQPGPCIVAHPAAIMMALLLWRARKAGAIRNAICTVFEPASEHGQKGMDELHQQTVNLLSFQPLPKDVFDAQVAFNMIARYGRNSNPSLDSVERRILGHYQKIAGEGAPSPSLQLLQAPIFHGYAMAIYLEMDQPVDASQLSQSLAGEHITLTSGEEEFPSNVNSAGQANILLSVKKDETRSHGVWLWAAADNLRLAAINAVECAENLAPTRPLGKIQ